MSLMFYVFCFGGGPSRKPNQPKQKANKSNTKIKIIDKTNKLAAKSIKLLIN